MRPWMGILPPQRYPHWGDQSETYRVVWAPVIDKQGTGLDEYINDVLHEQLRIQEEALTTVVVESLRQKGWTVTPPEPGV